MNNQKENIKEKYVLSQTEAPCSQWKQAAATAAVPPSLFHSTPAQPQPSKLLGSNTQVAWLHLPTKGSISLTSPHGLRPTYRAGAPGLVLGKGTESRRNGVLDFRRDKPDFKPLQAMLSRVERCFQITGGRKENKERARGKCNKEDRLSQEVNAEIRMYLPPQAPRSEPCLLHGGTPVSCLQTRHSFVQGTCCKFPRFLSPPFSANAFHTPSPPSHQEIHPWTKSRELRTSKQTNK